MAFWYGKKVLITGHTGFKGSWLSLWLQSMGAKVIGYALPPSTAINLFTLARVAEGMTSIIGDIRDFESLQSVVAKYQPEVVFHMAAQPLVRYSYLNPVETYGVNVMGTVHLLEAIRQVGCAKAVLNITTDKCYENREWFWGYRENDQLGGFDPYSNSKACAELVTSAYRDSYFNLNNYEKHKTALASARAGNVIGGGDWSQDRLLPDLMKACMEEKTVKIRNPDAIRPWQHVLEPLTGYLKLAEKLYLEGEQHAGAWNFGPVDEDVKPVGWLVKKLFELWNGKGSWEIDNQPQVHEATYLKLDCSKARTKLDWQPQWNLERTLEEIVKWYHAYQSKQDMQNVTLGQIKTYVTQTQKNNLAE